MTTQKLVAILYICSGLFLTIFFGGTLILQLLGVFAGLLMIHNGVKMISPSPLFTYAQFFSQSRFR